MPIRLREDSGIRDFVKIDNGNPEMAPKSSAVEGIPRRVPEWKILAKEWKALGHFDELGSQEKIYSASKFKFKHFLGLRVIYDVVEPGSKLPDNIMAQYSAKSSPSLEKLIGWEDYLKEIEKAAQRYDTLRTISQTCVPQSLGPFANVWQFHRHILLMNSTSKDISKISKVSPVGHRRFHASKRVLFQKTPTRAPKSKISSLSTRLGNTTIKSYAFEEDAEVIQSEEDEDSGEESEEGADVESSSESEMEEDSGSDSGTQSLISPSLTVSFDQYLRRHLTYSI